MPSFSTVSLKAMLKKLLYSSMMMCCFCALVVLVEALLRMLRVKSSRMRLSFSAMSRSSSSSMGARAFDTGFSLTKSKSENTALKMGADTSCWASISTASSRVMLSLRLARMEARKSSKGRS